MKIRFGADYYPEHWPYTRWETDARLMSEMGLNAVRMAEFSWVKMEPTIGVFDFEWLDRAISILGSYNIKTVLGTPTATPPAWLIEQSPEILPIDSSGITRGFGGRHHNCQSNQTYRIHIGRIIEAMAKHYVDNPHVVGWQIDNEFGNSHEDVCHCSSCKAAFHQWLLRKYVDINSLNAQWGTVFWSQTYSNFEQIPTPKITLNAHNPSMLLDWKRFHSDLIVEFQQFQIDILRRICTKHFITHNFMGFSDIVDYFKLAECLDFVSHDQYPMGFFDNPQPMKQPSKLAAALDLIRGLKQKNFWIMEQQAGPTGWQILSRTPRPGQLRLWVTQAVAHGAEAVVFFRWRTCSFGTEQYWHGILPHSGNPGERYNELKETITELVPLMNEIEGASSGAEVAILYSYEQNWALEIQPHHPDLDYVEHTLKYYAAFFNTKVPVDFINASVDFSKYKLVIAPLHFLMSSEMYMQFENYIRQGGHLLLTMRTGVKNMENVCMTDRELPGEVGNLLGIEIKDYDCLREMDMGVMFHGKHYRCNKWCDIITPITAKVVATYTEDYYAGMAAITVTATGKGKAYYVGTEPDGELMDEIVKWLVETCELSSIGSAPIGVELVRRRTDKSDFIFALNHTGKVQTLNAPEDWQPMKCGSEMEPYGMSVFKIKR